MAAATAVALLGAPGLVASLRLFRPTDRFYVTDVTFPPPSVGPRTWRLDVTGLVTRPLRLSYDDLLGMDPVEVDATRSMASSRSLRFDRPIPRIDAGAVGRHPDRSMGVSVVLVRTCP